MNRNHSALIFLLVPFFFVLLIMMQSRWQNRLAEGSSVWEQGGDVQAAAGSTPGQGQPPGA